MFTPIYSIIIPHKNIPHLLQRCIDSIPYRNDTEIIIVDDNSDENIVNFKKFPGNENFQVRVIFDKSNKGAGHARNVGLQKAKGEKILFADADDFFNYCINDVLDEYKDDISDIVYFNANSLDSEFYVNSNRAEHVNHSISLYAENKEKALNQLKYEFGEPWSKLLNKSFIKRHNILFDEIHSHNDTTFSYLSAFYARNIRIDKRALYCITVRSNSISVSLINSKKQLIRIHVFAQKELFFRKKNIESDVTIHWQQLLYFYENDKEYFNQSVLLLCKYGYKWKEIKNKLIKFHFRKYHNYYLTIRLYITLKCYK